MGKKKIELMDLIQDPFKRNVTFCKRKKGVIVKALELSKLCGTEVALYILDKPSNKIVTYNSRPNFDID